jgi:calcium-dependent protein kinase
MVILMARASVLLDRKWFVTSREDDIRGHYDLSKEIGAGGFGRVLLGTHIESGEVRAIKLIQKDKLENDQTFKTEIEIMARLDHPNIVRIIETFETSSLCCLVMEYCEGGELFSLICEKRTLTEAEAAVYMRQILSALAYCHDAKICHRDLKPDNLLLTYKTGSFEIKLADFGLSQSFSEEDLMHSISGTPYYIAPEMLSGSYNHLVDMWSLGVILYIMLSGCTPFNGQSNEEILFRVYAANYNFFPTPFSQVSHSAKDLIARMIMKDPSLRITARQALSHPWIRGADTLMKPLMDEVYQGIKSFINEQALKRATFMYLASRLAERELQDLKQVFVSLDDDQNGLLSYSEFEIGLRRLMTQSSDRDVKLRNLYNMIDSNLNGKIDYTEFLAACLHSQKYLNIGLIKSAFSFFDTDDSGFITKEELGRALNGNRVDGPQLDATCEEIIRLVDTNGDGMIDYMEFLMMMLEHHNIL